MQSETTAFLFLNIFIYDMVRNSLIENVVRKVILEYSGVSDEIMDISQEILSLIFQEEKNHDWKMSQVTGDYYKRFSLPIEGTEISKIVNEVLIRLFYYNPKQMNFEMAKEVYTETGDLKLAFSPMRNGIKIYIPFPGDGQMDEQGVQCLLSYINHEVKHAYQSRKRGGTIINNAYINSVKPMPDIDEKNLVIRIMRGDIRNLYYMFDKDEIDARLQEIYIQLMNNGGDLSKCNSYKKMAHQEKRYNWLKNELLFPPKDSFEMKYYKKEREVFKMELERMLGDEITPGEFFYHCESGIKRFREHVRRIIGRYRNEYGTPSGSFANYTKNEIPQSGMFKNGGKMEPELIRKMRRGYNKFRYGLK